MPKVYFLFVFFENMHQLRGFERPEGAGPGAFLAPEEDPCAELIPLITSPLHCRRSTPANQDELKTRLDRKKKK